MKFSPSPHRPIHLYTDNAWYFISASMIDHQKILATDEHLIIWRDVFHSVTAELQIAASAWVVQPNHYHVLVQPEKGMAISHFTNLLHGRTSFLMNKLDNQRGRKIWYSYWDVCMRNEQQFWARFNYIHYNPVKHGYVEAPEDWEFSSYRFYLEEQGKDWLWKCLQGYPVEELLEK
jgi:putative transposase